MKNKKAEMGMGTLIIFIAMVLVAAVAAGVLITTTGSLQNRALNTGRATSQEVGTNLNVVRVFAEDGSNQEVERFTLIVRLSAGSEPIRFDDLLLTLSLSDENANEIYNDAATCANAAEGTGYAVEYSINTTNSRTGYLVTGDVAKICFESPRPVEEAEDVVVSLIPKVGTPTRLGLAMPSLMLDTRVQLFP
ncbi:MAG: archaellin/type IV pilin N-terminal domain-containing protein [Candidatus Woesearchaeota archaeon]